MRKERDTTREEWYDAITYSNCWVPWRNCSLQPNRIRSVCHTCSVRKRDATYAQPFQIKQSILVRIPSLESFASYTANTLNASNVGSDTKSS